MVTIREVGVLLGAGVVYFGGRVLVEGPRDEAVANAEQLLDVERTLRLDVETGMQQFAADNDLFRVLGNLSYVWLHWPLLLAVLVLLYRRDPVHYRQFRNAVFVSGVIGLVMFATIPMAPPRFLEGHVGTVSDAARTHYLNYPLSWSNQHAAFPSFHVGWTLIACIALASILPGRAAKAIAIVPGVLVAVSVVSTGNHYVLDSVVGAGIALLAYLAFGHLDRPTGSSPNGHAQTDTTRRHDIASRRVVTFSVDSVGQAGLRVAPGPRPLPPRGIQVEDW